MSAVRKRYAAIDLGKREAEAWPSPLPALTGPEAMRAFRRLFRYSMGETFAGRAELTSGNRHTWERRGIWYVNPDLGWRRLVHDLSHLFVRRCDPSERPHSKFHARFEAKLVREVIRRGWLDGRLRDHVKAAEIQAAPSLDDRRRDKLARIEARIQSWERKEKRARRALAKLERSRKYYAAKVTR